MNEFGAVQVLVLGYDAERRHATLSTKHLEHEPGAMLRDKGTMFARAEETLRERGELAAQRKEKKGGARPLLPCMHACLVYVPGMLSLTRGMCCTRPCMCAALRMPCPAVHAAATHAVMVSAGAGAGACMFACAARRERVLRRDALWPCTQADRGHAAR